MENTTQQTNYSIDYILAQIAAIREQATTLTKAIEEASFMSDEESNAFWDGVKRREATNQQMLRMYEKMYEDLPV